MKCCYTSCKEDYNLPKVDEKYNGDLPKVSEVTARNTSNLQKLEVTYPKLVKKTSNFVRDKLKDVIS